MFMIDPNDKIWDYAIPIMICIIVSFIILALIIMPILNKNVYNNGVHKNCGGHWQYDQVVGHDNYSMYAYKCDKCGTVHEFYNQY